MRRRPASNIGPRFALRALLLGASAVTATAVHALGQQPTFLPPQPPAAQTVCEGTMVTYALSVDFGGAASPLITWSFDGGSGFVPLADGDRGGRVDIVNNVSVQPATTVLTVTNTDASPDAGAYRCTATSAAGGTFVTFTLSFHDPPGTSPSVVYDGVFNGVCRADTVWLNANASGSDPPNQVVVWSIDSGPNLSVLQFLPHPAVANPFFKPFAAGTYVLRATTFDCDPAASGSGTLTVAVFPPLAANPVPTDADTCVTVPVPLSANASGGNGSYAYQWTVTPQNGSFFSPNASAANPTFTAVAALPSGGYLLTVTVSPSSSAGAVCSPSPPANVTITAQAELAVDADADDAPLCLGDQTTVRADTTPPDGTFTYEWQIIAGPDLDPDQLSSTTAAAPTFTPSTATSGQPYELTVEVSGGACTPGSDMVDIVVYDTPSVNPTATPATICAGHPAHLFANATGSDTQGFLWSVVSGPDLSDQQFTPFPTAENPTFTPTLTGTYRLRVAVFDADCDDPTPQTVDVVARVPLSANPTPAETTVCTNTPVPLSANPAGGNGGYAFLWTIVSAPAGGGSDVFSPSPTAQNPVFTPTVAGTYQLAVVVDADGCDESAPANVLIHVTGELSVTAGATDTDFCRPGSTLVHANAGGGNVSYHWSVEDGPNGPDPGGTEFGNPAAASTLFTPSAAGDYTLRVDALLDGGDCGDSSDTLDITVYPSAIAVAHASDDTLCLGDETQLSVDTGGGGPPSQFITWSVLSGPDTSPSQFSDDTAPDPLFTPTFPTTPGGEYVIGVDVFDTACATLLDDDLLITVYETLDAQPAADPNLTCAAVPVDIRAEPAGGDGSYTFTWSVQSGPADPPPTIGDVHAEETTFTPTVGPATYTLALLVGDGSCLSAQPVYFLNIPVRAPLAVAPSAQFSTGVLGVPMLLHANGTGGTQPSYAWNILQRPSNCPANDSFTGVNTANPTFTPGCIGTYTFSLVATDPVCTTASAGLNLNVVLFTAEPTADPPALCDHGATTSAVLNANLQASGNFGNFNYLWTILPASPNTSPTQFSPGPTSPNPTFTPSASGVYTLRVRADDVNNQLPDIIGEFDIEVSADGPAIAGNPVDAAVCAGEPATFTAAATGTDLSYQWLHDGVALPEATAPTLAIQTTQFSDAGTYTCTVSNGCDQASTSPATLIVDPPIAERLFAVVREDDLLREAAITGCTISGTLSDRGPMGANIQRVTGLAVHPTTGALYAAVRHFNNPPPPETSLAVLDPTTGAASIIGTMGQPIGDLAFDPTDDVLYAIRGNHSCPLCSDPDQDQPGDMFIVNLADATLSVLDPPLSFGDEEGHTIAFDAQGLLYHHGRDPLLYSRLTRTDLTTRQQEILRDYPLEVSLTAITIHDDLFIAARRSSPSVLWSIDPDDEFQETVLGPITAPGVSNRTVMGLAFACTAFGDADCDGDIDLDDFLQFEGCATQPAPVPPSCWLFDHDGDGDVDLPDWGRFQSGFTGGE